MNENSQTFKKMYASMYKSIHDKAMYSFVYDRLNISDIPKNIFLLKYIHDLCNYCPSWCMNDYAIYAKEILFKIKKRAERKSKFIYPQRLCEDLSDIFPEEIRPTKTFYSWEEISAWARNLEVKAASEKIDSKQRSCIHAASNITIVTVYFFQSFYNSTKKIDDPLSWDWCPLCWRPVINSNGKKKCKYHKTGTAGYYKINRLLKKIRPPVMNKHDNLPLEKRNKLKRKAEAALEKGIIEENGDLSCKDISVSKQRQRVECNDMIAYLKEKAGLTFKNGIIEGYDDLPYKDRFISKEMSKDEYNDMINYLKEKLFGLRLGYDRLPVDLQKNARELFSIACDYGFPDRWLFFSFTKEFILKQMPNADQNDIDACLSDVDVSLEILSPGAIELFKNDKMFPDLPATDQIEKYRMAMLSRAEIWLRLEAEHCIRGGRRKNAGRTPKTEL